MQFELSYTDKDGSRVQKTLDCDFKTARTIAQELAKSSGRRAIITRKTQRAWRVYVVDAITREKRLLWSNLSKREALMRWRLWNDWGTQAVLIVLPQWYLTDRKSKRNAR